MKTKCDLCGLWEMRLKCRRFLKNSENLAGLPLALGVRLFWFWVSAIQKLNILQPPNIPARMTHTGRCLTIFLRYPTENRKRNCILIKVFCEWNISTCSNMSQHCLYFWHIVWSGWFLLKTQVWMCCESLSLQKSNSHHKSKHPSVSFNTDSLLKLYVKSEQWN